MADKQLLLRSKVGEKILHGASAQAGAVRVTLSPKSKSVLIKKKRHGVKRITNSGTGDNELTANAVAPELALRQV